jgi:glycerol-3-phosphate dehydrogenase
MARTVEDVLARRTRNLFLNAQAAWDVAPIVAKTMAKELAQDPAWEADQVEKFRETARCFML